MISWSRRDVVRVVVSTVSAVSSSEIVVTVSLKQKTVIYLHFNNSQSNQQTQTEMKRSPFWPVSKPDWYFRHRQGGYQGFVSGDDLRLCPQSCWCSLWTRNFWEVRQNWAEVLGLFPVFVRSRPSSDCFLFPTSDSRRGTPGDLLSGDWSGRPSHTEWRQSTSSLISNLKYFSNICIDTCFTLHTLREQCSVGSLHS